MPTVGQKAEYVRDEARKGAGGHHCHWPGCDKPVPPAMWGCKRHWYMRDLEKLRAMARVASNRKFYEEVIEAVEQHECIEIWGSW